ncbi:hypothetical protein [Halolamina litorea]|uniref:Uncharacterized protein n=1 Tax=Halolamina litorea TaxID=1515593 RepID=A0ABD6BLK9_9EURY
MLLMAEGGARRRKGLRTQPG